MGQASRALAALAVILAYSMFAALVVTYLSMRPSPLTESMPGIYVAGRSAGEVWVRASMPAGEEGFASPVYGAASSASLIIAFDSSGDSLVIYTASRLLRAPLAPAALAEFQRYFELSFSALGVEGGACSVLGVEVSGVSVEERVFLVAEVGGEGFLRAHVDGAVLFIEAPLRIGVISVPVAEVPLELRAPERGTLLNAPAALGLDALIVLVEGLLVVECGGEEAKLPLAMVAVSPEASLKILEGGLGAIAPLGIYYCADEAAEPLLLRDPELQYTVEAGELGTALVKVRIEGAEFAAKVDAERACRLRTPAGLDTPFIYSG